jgi:hypothetical protein
MLWYTSIGVHTQFTQQNSNLITFPFKPNAPWANDTTKKKEKKYDFETSLLSTAEVTELVCGLRPRNAP